MSQNFDSNQNYYSFIDNDTDPLVFIHGVGLDHRMWEPQIKSLNDHSIIAYDLLGHGRTPYDKEEITLNDFSNQLDDLLQFLKIDKINKKIISEEVYGNDLKIMKIILHPTEN